MSTFPVFTNLKGKRCLIVGGGEAALSKARILLECEAHVTVAADLAIEPLLQLCRDKGIRRIPEAAAALENPAFLTILTQEDLESRRKHFLRLNARNHLVNSHDDPEHCNFTFGSVARDGQVLAAVSTSGLSPAYGQYLRDRILHLFSDEKAGNVADFFGKWRNHVKASIPLFESRARLWRRLIATGIPELIRKGRDAEARDQLLEPRRKVYLVGAGPGDPSLLTVKGARVLARADVILYDRLVHPELLDIAPAGAARIFVGKEPYSAVSSRQEFINAQLIQLAREGKTVVRLKGGDPFVFGRGSEEALALQNAGIPFEVIPGISSAIAVPGSAGIPVTHRGVAAGFAVFTAHQADEEPEGPALDWELAAKAPTAVFLMGVRNLPVIVSQLLNNGRAADTPVAVIEKGTLPEEKVITGTLQDICALTQQVGYPATIVVGEVVSIRSQLQSHSCEGDQHYGPPERSVSGLRTRPLLHRHPMHPLPPVQ